MSKKRANYTSAFKTKLVLELLQNKNTLAEIASKHNILPQNLVNWKKTFLANAEIAMEPSKTVKEYKEELIKSQEQNECSGPLILDTFQATFSNSAIF